MPLPTTFAGVSTRGAGQFGPPPFSIGAPYWAEISSSTANTNLSDNYSVWGSYVDKLGNVYQLVVDSSASGRVAVQKFNLSGTLLFTTDYLYGFTIPVGINNLTVDSSGNIYITGVSPGLPGGGIIVKLNSSGTFQWSNTRVATGIGRAYFNSPFIDSSGNIWVAGTLYDNGGTGYRYASFYKYNSSGTLLNTYSFNNASSSFYCNAQTKDNSGNIIGVGNNSLNPTIISFSSSTGTRNWSQTLNLSNASTFTSVVTDSSNNIYVAGVNSNGPTSQAIIVKYNSSGTVQWQYNTGIACATPDTPTLIIDSLGNIILGARDNVSNYTYLVKVSSSGTVVWVDRFYLYSLTTPQPWTVNTMFNDVSNNIYVGGTYQDSNGGSIPNGGYLLKLLGNGSKTGSYTVGNTSLVISSSSVTLTSSSYTTTSFTPGTASDNTTNDTTKISVASSTTYNANKVL